MSSMPPSARGNTRPTPRRAAVRAPAKQGARAAAFAAQGKARRVDNRVVVIVRPRAPFIDWINSSDPDAPEIPLEQACAEPNIFLLPANDATDARPLGETWERDFDRISTVSSGADAQARTDDWLTHHWTTLFDRLLQDWDVDIVDCPQPRSMALFLAWFDVHTHTAVFDYADEPLRYQAQPARPAEYDV